MPGLIFHSFYQFLNFFSPSAIPNTMPAELAATSKCPTGMLSVINDGSRYGME